MSGKYPSSPEPITSLTALGDPDLVLEYLDFFNGGRRFSYNEEASRVRDNFAGSRITKIHLICTRANEKALETLQTKVAAEYPDVLLEPAFLQCEDIENKRDEQEMKETVYGLVARLSREGRLIISSGGRKTMTNRLIEAGLLYGCEGYLAITDSRQTDRKSSIRQQSHTFNVLWIPARQFYRERRNSILDREGIGDNFRSLTILPQTIIDRLHSERIGVDPANKRQELAWLQSLPKADLHCHLGGAFDPPLLKQLALLMVEECGIDDVALRQAIEHHIGHPVRELSSGQLRSLEPKARHCLHNLKLLLPEADSAELVPALVAGLSEEQIQDLSFDGRDIQDCRNMDLDWYIACGDLGGSSLLQTESCLRTALGWLLQKAYDDGVRYIEVRCSPANYCRQGLGIRNVLDILIDEGSRFMADHDDFTVHFLVMATRHKSRAAMASHVSAAVCYAAGSGGQENRVPRVVGFDLAGQEEDYDPVRFQDLFMPLHHHFINITIHAGEMESDDKIWQALYLLHAKRIGHGLKLVNNARMMDYVRDYGTAVEMCPSSNIQTNDFMLASEQAGSRYPLEAYLDHGIEVTINTDNLGISATRLSREYWLAGRLSRKGLSRWQILKLVRNGFRAAFLPKDRKDRLLKQVDRQIFQIVMDNFFPEASA